MTNESDFPDLVTARALSARLFGAGLLQVLTDTGQVSRVLGPGKPLLLIARLLHAPQGMTRDSLAAFLWPTINEVRARSSLRQALFQLREILGPDVIRSDRRHVALVGTLDSDVRDFLAALDAGDDARAVALYGGPFLADLAIADAAEVELWITIERARYHQLFLRAARREAARLLAHEQHDNALALLTRIRDDDPDDLQSWKQLFDALASVGDTIRLQRELVALRVRAESDTGMETAAALRLVARFEARDPWAPTRVVYGGEQATPGAITSRPPFVGRQHELARLHALWDLARRGHGQRLVVRGYAGLGKSRLLEEFVRSPKTDGAVVLWIRARRGGRDHPMAFLADLVQSMASLPGSMSIMQQTAAVLVGLVPSLIGQFPGVQWHEPPSLRDESLTAAFRELLATLAEEQPILIVLDDLHWADAVSINVIDQATSALHGIAACIVIATRPRQDHVGDTWDALNLVPLGATYLQAFVQGVTGARIDAAVVETLQQIGAGNPLHTLQAMRLLMTRGAIQRHQESWSVDHDALHGMALTTQDLLAAMIGDLSAAARRVLVYLALADTAVATATLERVLAGAAPINDVLRALDEADLAQPLDGHCWRIGHDLVADLVLHQAPVALRRELSLDVAVHAEADAVTVADMRRVVRWYLDAEAPDAMLHAVRRWAARTKPGPKGAALADLLLGAGATPVIRTRLVRAVPERSRITIPIVLTVLATTVCLITVLSLWLHQPARLVLVNQPMHLIYVGTPPMLEVRNRLGQISTALDGSRVQLVTFRGADSITGVDRTPIAQGIVVLDSMRIWRGDKETSPQTEATMQVGTMAPVSFPLTGSSADSLWLESGMLNNQPLTLREPTIRIRRGEQITGWIRARYSVAYGGILVMMAQYTNWREPREDTLSLTSLLVPAQRAYYYNPRVDLAGPTQPGTYWLIWTFASETAANWITSSTSWKCGAPVWDDGNEKGRMPASVYSGAWGSGRTTFRKLLCEAGEPRRYETHSVPAMAIRIVVE